MDASVLGGRVGGPWRHGIAYFNNKVGANGRVLGGPRDGFDVSMG